LKILLLVKCVEQIYKDAFISKGNQLNKDETVLKRKLKNFWKMWTIPTYDSFESIIVTYTISMYIWILCYVVKAFCFLQGCFSHKTNFAEHSIFFV